jgi:hypothetical protein
MRSIVFGWESVFNIRDERQKNGISLSLKKITDDIIPLC